MTAPSIRSADEQDRLVEDLCTAAQRDGYDHVHGVLLRLRCTTLSNLLLAHLSLIAENRGGNLGSSGTATPNGSGKEFMS